jgi:D-alanyl-D-alanine carboxypeptidase
MRSWFAASVGTVFLGVAACTTANAPASNPSAEPNPTHEAAEAGADETASGSASASTPCVALSAVVQPAVDASRTKARTTDVAVGLITRDCPFLSIVSGPSQLTADSRFRIGSITKTYTAAVILHFVAAGALALDDTIASFKLGITNDTQITVRQLLNHTSGLFNYTDDPAFPSHLDWTPRERLQAAETHPVYFPPGKGWHYSNTNFIALGLIAEKLGGAPMERLIRSIVLEPNAFGATYFQGPEEVEGTIAPSFKRNGVPSTATATQTPAWADGALVATLEDATRWMRRYASGEATPSLKNELLTAVPAPDKSVRYGLAVMVVSSALGGGNGTSYGHGGDITGFHSVSFYFPDKEWTITAIVNTDTGDPNSVFVDVLDALTAAKL